jgi:glycosyltransferase involved in cell wall biosynthesis
MNKLVSIILPTYNGSPYIKKAIESVLSQTYKNWELIIIDDCSLDRTSSIVANYINLNSNIKYIKNNENLGVQKSLNKGLSVSKGEYIARIDDDDEWIDVDKLKTQVEFLESNIGYVLIGTGALLVDEDDELLSKYLLPKSDLEIKNKILSKNCFVHSSVLFKKNTAQEVGGFSENEAIKHVEDYDLWLRLGMKGKLFNLNTYSTALRVRSQSLTYKNRVTQAKRILNLIVKYRKIYPRFTIGYIIALFRLVFFIIQNIFPIPMSYIYRIQKVYKGL